MIVRLSVACLSKTVCRFVDSLGRWQAGSRLPRAFAGQVDRRAPYHSSVLFMLLVLVAPCLSAQISSISRIFYGYPLIDSLPGNQFPRGGGYTAIVGGFGLANVTGFQASDPRVTGYVISATDTAVTMELSSTPVNDPQDAPIPSVSFSLIDNTGHYIPSPVTFSIVTGPAPQVPSFSITNGVNSIVQGIPTPVAFSYEVLSSGNIQFDFIGCGNCTIRDWTSTVNQFDYVSSFTAIVNIPTTGGPVTSFGIAAGAVDGSGQQGRMSLTIPVFQGGGCGDDRDNLIAEYDEYGVNLQPECAWFTQSAHSQHFTFNQINYPCISQGGPEYSWALFAQPLLIPASSGYGLDRWQEYYTELTGDQRPRTINSGYRDPFQNELCGGATQSQHQYGTAVDFRNVTRTENEWNNMWSAAGLSGARADWREPRNGPCKIGCVHADWRWHRAYQSSGSMGNDERKSPPSDIAVDEILGEFQSSRWEARSDAFYGLLKLVSGKSDAAAELAEEILSLARVSSKSDRIRRALVSLLLRENEYATTQQQLSETYTDYYGNLVWEVSLLREPESLNALLGAINTGGMATSAIAAFGGRAIMPIIELLNNNDVFTRESATGVLSEMLQPENARTLSDIYARQQIKRGLLKSAADPSPYVRIAAVAGLLRLGDRDCVSVLKDLSANDSTEASELGGERGYYPVREAASKALLQLER